MHGCTLRDALELWFLKHTIHDVHCYVPIFVYWCIWLCRNKSIFEDKPVMILDNLHHIDYFMHYYPIPGIKTKSKNIGIALVMVFPCGFFYGAIAESEGGAGIFIAIISTHILSFKLGCGLQQILEHSFCLCGLS